MEIFTFEEGKVLTTGTGITVKEIFTSGKVTIQQVLLHTGGKLEKYTDLSELFY